MTPAMHTWPAEALLALAIVNFLLCSVIAWSCLCRFSVMTREHTSATWRLRYIIMLVAASASGISFLWGEWQGPARLCMAVGCLFVLGLTARGWRQGTPQYARRPQPLPPDQLQHVAGGRGSP
jgi:hypothetical protein